MCNHCCNLRYTPCPIIPYACPYCPVQTVASACECICTRGCPPPSDHRWHMVLHCWRSCYRPNPKRWLDVNLPLIMELAKRLHCSPEAVQYMLLHLLYSDFSDLLHISPRRKSNCRPCKVPMTDPLPCGQEFELFDKHGNLRYPMAPHTLGDLLRALQTYIIVMEQLNRKFKWHNKGVNDGNLIGLLGNQNDLVRLLGDMMQGKGRQMFPIDELLHALNDINLEEVFGKRKLKKSYRYAYEDLSDLYSAVAGDVESAKEKRRRQQQNEAEDNKDKCLPMEHPLPRDRCLGAPPAEPAELKSKRKHGKNAQAEGERSAADKSKRRVSFKAEPQRLYVVPPLLSI